MINANTYGSKILNIMLHTGSAYSETFTSTPYLALYTTMPDANVAGAAEPTDSAYTRVLLSAKGVNQTNLLGTAVVVDGDGTNAGKKLAQVTNQELIFFPEAQTAWGQIVGFGIYENKGATTPYFWGELTAPTAVEAEEIAIFRVGDFKITLC